jgi:chemotaxis response regulator CheB
VRRAHKKVAATRKSIACPIVGIGGSDGGFEAMMDLLRHLPAKNGMTFRVVQHLDPHHASKLASLLGKVTAMPVIEVTKTTKANPNTVYVQPPNKCVVIKNGALKLVRRTRRLNVAIDQFLDRSPHPLPLVKSLRQLAASAASRLGRRREK